MITESVLYNAEVALWAAYTGRQCAGISDVVSKCLVCYYRRKIISGLFGFFFHTAKPDILPCVLGQTVTA